MNHLVQHLCINAIKSNQHRIWWGLRPNSSDISHISGSEWWSTAYAHHFDWLQWEIPSMPTVAVISLLALTARPWLPNGGCALSARNHCENLKKIFWKQHLTGGEKFWCIALTLFFSSTTEPFVYSTYCDRRSEKMIVNDNGHIWFQPRQHQCWRTSEVRSG